MPRGSGGREEWRGREGLGGILDGGRSWRRDGGGSWRGGWGTQVYDVVHGKVRGRRGEGSASAF